MNLLYARNTNFELFEANKVQVVNMCKAFSENGCKVTLIAFGKSLVKFEKRYCASKEFKTFLIDKNIDFIFQGELILFLKFLRMAKGFEIVYTRDIIFAILVKIFFRRKKVFLEIHDVPKKWWWKWIFIKYTKILDHVIVISQGLKDGLVRIGISNDNLSVMHDGVDLAYFDINIAQDDARNFFSLSKDTKIVAYIGSTNKDRDILTLIEVAKKMPNVNFVIFGKEQGYINSATKTLPNVIFKGYTDKSNIACKAADILFAGYSKNVPTIEYMSPLKIFEYMASKRPIVVANFPRIREIISENEAYFYLDGNSFSLQKNIENIFDYPDNARNKALKAFSKVGLYSWRNRAYKILNTLNKDK